MNELVIMVEPTTRVLIYMGMSWVGLLVCCAPPTIIPNGKGLKFYGFLLFLLASWRMME